MTALPIPPFPDNHRIEHDSPNSINVDSDGPGDNTIRPCRPERRAFLEADREKLRRWQTGEAQPEPPSEGQGAA
jgi:hypothetical protein